MFSLGFCTFPGIFRIDDGFVRQRFADQDFAADYRWLVNQLGVAGN